MVDVVHPTKFDEKSTRDIQRVKTLELLQRLGGGKSQCHQRHSRERPAGRICSATGVPINFGYGDELSTVKGLWLR